MLRWSDETLYHGLADVAKRYPDEPALIADESTITYRELLDRSRSVAMGFAALGISEGDTIALWLSNRTEWITTQLAASYLGAAVVAVNTRYRRHELEYMLKDSKASLIVTEHSFVGTDYFEMLAEIIPEMTDSTPEEFDPDSVATVTEIVSTSRSEGYPAVREFDSVREMGVESEAGAEAVAPTTDSERPVVIFYTSGTTGDPKGCVHDSRSVLNHSHQVGQHFEVSSDDVGITLLPLCGIMGYNFALSVLTHGATAVLQPYFESEQVLDRLRTHDVTYLSGTDEMFSRLMEADGFNASASRSVQRGATFFANGFDEERFERIESAFGFPIVQPYGLSEANSQIFVGDPSDSRTQRKRVGGPLIHPEEEAAKVVDPETGDELPPGEQGELHLKGYNVLKRYLGKPGKTDEDIVDGWLRTGDLCERDDQGYVYFNARMDDALRVRGFLVSPRDIELAIDAHPAVEQSQVVGTPHPRHGEVPVGFVKLADDVRREDIESHLADRIADYKRPEGIVIVDEFPRAEGPHGEKIQKAKLRERVEEWYTDAET